jgi:thioredoxin 1
MNQPTTQDSFSPPWFLIIGLLAGGGLIAMMTWDSFGPRKAVVPSSAEVIELTSANWQQEVVESKIPVVVDFGATWCPPCRKLSPTIDSLAAQYKGKIKVGKVDVDQSADLAKKYKIGPIPHVFIFNGGEEPRVSFEGLKSEAVYARAIDGVLAGQ